MKKSDKYGSIEKIVYGVLPGKAGNMSKIEDYFGTLKAEAPAKFEEMKENIKLKNFLKKKEAEEIIEEVEEERKVKVWIIILAIIGVIAIGCLVGYLISKVDTRIMGLSIKYLILKRQIFSLNFVTCFLLLLITGFFAILGFIFSARCFLVINMLIMFITIVYII